MVAGRNNLSTLLHPSALGNLVIFPLGLELAYHLTSFNYCLQSCSQFSTGQVPTAISRPSAIGLVVIEAMRMTNAGSASQVSGV